MKSVLVLSVLLGVGFAASVSKGSRGNCPQFCPTILSPVCASDGAEFRTFSNDCHLTAFNCWQARDFQRLRDGECDEGGDSILDRLSKTVENKVELTEKRCKPCTRIYLPICGVEGQEKRVFPNVCDMEYLNCKERREFVLLKEGLC